MKKIYLITLLLSSVFMFSQSKNYSEMISEGTYTIQEIQDAAEGYFENRGKGKGTGYKQYKRWEYQALRSMNENGILKSPTFYYNELERYNNYRNQNAVHSRISTPDTGNWEALGPTFYNGTSNHSPGTGRVTSVAFETGNESHMIVGGETGGVWKTTNGGTNWTVLTDNLSNLNVYALAMHPTNALIYYWGSNDGTIFKSMDAGATWNIAASAIGDGDVNRILIDPNTPTKMYCSISNGGLFKSTNSGASWSIIHTDATKGYDFEFKPRDPSVVYASGTAVFKSTDGGANFIKLTVPAGLPNYTTEYPIGTIDWKSANRGWERFGVADIFPKTGDGLGLFLKGDGSGNVGDKTKIITPVLNLSTATNPIVKFSYALPDFFGNVDQLKVYYKTSAAGAWVQLSGANYSVAQDTWLDVTLSLPNPSAEYYVAFEGEVSSGGGVTLDDISIEDATPTVFFSDGFETPTPNVFGNGAKMLAVSADNSSVVYLLETNSTVGTGSFQGLYKSTDNGAQFVPLNHEGKNYLGRSLSATDPSDATVGQAPRDMDIAVNPNNVNEVHIAGVNIWRSLDGGVGFSQTANWDTTVSQPNNLGYSHADVDLLEFAGNTLYTATDGGVYKATNSSGAISTAYFTDLSSGLGIRQFIRFGISQTNPVVITGGAQDNGSATRTSTGIWRDWYGGDGMEGFVDKTNSQIIYGTSQRGDLGKSDNGGLGITGIISPSEGNWVTPFEQDPIAVDVLYAGYKQVYKSIDGGIDWDPISQEFDKNLDELKIAQSLPTTMYASYEDRIFKTTTGSGTWTELTQYFGDKVTSIAIHPTNPDKVAVANTGSEKVYVTTNGGTSWTSYKYDLPNFSALAVVWDNNGNDGLYLGMDYGVYYIDSTTSNSWKTFSNNLPNVKISELEINYADNKLYVATYGRGIWRTPRYDINTLSAVNTELEEGITIFPNPASETLSIVSSKKEMATIRVFNALGKLMHYSKDINLTNGFKIDVSPYATGLYFVRINNEKGITTKKLIVD